MARSILLSVMILGAFTLSASLHAASPARDSVYTVVDKAPRFKGKPSEPQKFFERHMVYPEEARAEAIQGVVNVSFVITDDGRLLEPEITKSVDPLLDSEALRLVGLMGKWKPAEKGGEAVNSRVTLPVPFQLSPTVLEPLKILQKYGLQDKKPLYILNDNIVKEMVELPGYNVKSIRVMKGEKAVERYGEQAADGVVIITTKRGTPPVR